MARVQQTNSDRGFPPPLRSRGFTLIELLVVISIIALLIGILLPVLGRARGTARLTVCATQMRQIGYGFFAHAAENDDEIAPAYRETDSGGNWSWDDWLIEDMGGNRTNPDKDKAGALDRAKSLDILACPSDPALSDSPNQAIRSYAMPQSGFDGVFSNKTPRGVGVDGDYPLFHFGSGEVPQPTNTALLVEQSDLQGSGTPNRQGQQSRAAIDGPFRQILDDVAVLHGSKNDRRYNYLFVDGHVAAHQPKDTLGPGQTFGSGKPGGYWSRESGD